MNSFSSPFTADNLSHSNTCNLQVKEDTNYSSHQSDLQKVKENDKKFKKKKTETR